MKKANTFGNFLATVETDENHEAINVRMMCSVQVCENRSRNMWRTVASFETIKDAQDYMDARVRDGRMSAWDSRVAFELV